jgi:hexosaminidase
MELRRVVLWFFLPCLWAAPHDYGLLPAPQRVTLAAAGDFQLGSAWRIERQGVPPGDIAVESLREGLDSRFRLRLSAGTGGVLKLVIAPGSVAPGDALDSDKAAIAAQTYRIDLRRTSVTITANAAPGLFYGVQTLLQLVRSRDGGLWLPKGQITDWPDLRLRQIYWDDAHHLERPEAFRDAIRQAAFYKINGIVLKLEGHFQYASASAIVEPYALTPAELQALTDYALRYHVQLIPYLDAPSHIAFILKHPEYSALREFPDSNYEACAVDPAVYRLYEGLFTDLLAANRGGKYFYLSTDEAYYIGLGHDPQCDEAARAGELGSVGKLLAEFVTRTAGWLHEHGREVMFWGEFPLKPADIASLPPWLINGEVYGPQFDPLFKRHGIRQTVFVSTQGEERHFPGYFPLPADRRLHLQTRAAIPRIEEIFRKVTADPARQTADLIGVVNAGWADAGLHPETFWLGYATGTASAWNPTANVQEAVNAFYRQFYGPNAVDMDRLYRLMSWQAAFWSDSWETGPSTSRKPIWGNSNHIYSPRQPARDQFLPLPLPDPGRRLELVAASLKENDELIALLERNLQHADFNRYNLEVFLSIAKILRHNLTFLAGLGRMQALLDRTLGSLDAMDQALTIAAEVRADRDAVLRDATAVWYRSWYPRVPEANGRKFLHELDDVKDHPGDRTVDLSYMIEREFLLPFGEWVSQIRSRRNEFARAHGLPEDVRTFEW